MFIYNLILAASVLLKVIANHLSFCIFHPSTLVTLSNIILSYIINGNTKINLEYAAGHMKYESPIESQHHPDQKCINTSKLIKSFFSMITSLYVLSMHISCIQAFIIYSLCAKKSCCFYVQMWLDTHFSVQNLRQVWLCFLPFVYLKSFYLIKKTFFFLLKVSILFLLMYCCPLRC